MPTFRGVATQIDLLIVAVLGPFVVLIAGEPAHAEVYNCGAESNWHDGMYHQGGYYIGVSANITVRYGAVCDTDTHGYNTSTGAVGNFTTAWSMLADTYNVGWLQSGFLRSYGQALVHVSQFYNAYEYGGIPVTRFGSVVNAGEVHRYWQQYYPDASGEWHSNVDTTRFINVAPGVMTYGWSGYSQQFSGETAYRESDIPGGQSYPTSFNNLQVQTSQTVFQSIPSPFLVSSNADNPARWSLQPTSGTSFNIWTQVYS